MSKFYSYGLKKVELRTKLFLYLFRNRYKKYLSGYRNAFDGKCGLEISGPSDFFSSDILPIYKWAEKIDGCNFSNNTIWEGKIETDDYNYFPEKAGRQYIMEGTDLSEIEDDKYDFLLSSHNLEHIANPLKALEEWIRVIKPWGFYHAHFTG